MNIVQTFWPGDKSTSTALKSSYGWLSPLFHYMSWALSVHQLKCYYDKVILHTNDIGKKILIDFLELPYSQVELSLNHLNSFPSPLWAATKLHTYSIQKQPFIHVDSDVFIWKEFCSHKVPELFAQNFECNFQINNESLNIARNLDLRFPESLLDVKYNDSIDSINAGILGGHDLHFLNSYAKEGLNFIEANKAIFNKKTDLNYGPLNCLVEQIFFYYLANKENKYITFLLHEKFKNQTYKGLVDFENVPNSYFLHALATYKKNRIVCSQLANTLKNYHPTVYYKLIKHYKADYDFWLLKDPMINTYNIFMKNCR